jgi:hypothetical protein
MSEVVSMTTVPVEQRQPWSLDLFWIPLGAGARVVRTSGRIYERCLAAVQHRRPGPLFHSALVATTPAGRYFIEVTPVPASGSPDTRGVVGTGAVGSRLLGRFRLFRYELRRWLDGVIPDIGFAVGSPVRITDEPMRVREVIDLVPSVPTPVWGRDELHTGEMWNSNSVISWVLTRAALDDVAGRPPHGGRAPGWAAGLAVAQRAPVSTHEPWCMAPTRSRSGADHPDRAIPGDERIRRMSDA